MKKTVLFFLLIPNILLSQEGNPLGILGVEVYGNSAILKDDSAWRNCGVNCEMIITQLEGDTLGWFQMGTGLTNCDCLFNLSVTLDSLNPGDYFVKAFFEDSYSPDTVYIGLITFTILGQNTFSGFAVTSEYQSPCGIVSTDELDPIINSITLGPNPASDRLFIHIGNISGKTNYQISNLNGLMLKEGRIKLHESELDITALPPGVYFVRVQDEKRVEVVKLIKQ